MKKVYGLVVSLLVWGAVMESKTDQKKTLAFFLTSPSFVHNTNIPSKFTCDGTDISPELAWGNAPQATQSFALIVDDPDAPGGDWVHWIVFNIPATMSRLEQGTSVAHFATGVNDFDEKPRVYGGPCPPHGTHHYHFKLYALDTLLDATQAFTKQALLAAMEGHILAQAELVGLYKRKR